MFIKSLDPAGTWLIDNEQYTQGMDPIELIINDSILFFFSHFFPLFYFLMEAKLPRIVHYSFCENPQKESTL